MSLNNCSLSVVIINLLLLRLRAEYNYQQLSVADKFIIVLPFQKIRGKDAIRRLVTYVVKLIYSQFCLLSTIPKKNQKISSNHSHFLLLLQSHTRGLLLTNSNLLHYLLVSIGLLKNLATNNRNVQKVINYSNATIRFTLLPATTFKS